MNTAKKQLLAYIQNVRDKFTFTETCHYILMDVIDGCNESASLDKKQLEFVTQHANAIANSIKTLESTEKDYRAKMASIALATYINACK